MKIIFPLKADRQYEGSDLSTFGIDFTLSYFGIPTDCIQSLHNSNNQESVSEIQSICYVLGIYYEEFMGTSVDYFKEYLQRNLRMAVSIPIISLPKSMFTENADEKELVLMPCIGFSEEAFLIVCPYEENIQLREIDYSVIGCFEYTFIFLNFPDMHKAKIISNYPARIDLLKKMRAYL